MLCGHSTLLKKRFVPRSFSPGRAARLSCALVAVSSPDLTLALWDQLGHDGALDDCETCHACGVAVGRACLAWAGSFSEESFRRKAFAHAADERTRCAKEAALQRVFSASPLRDVVNVPRAAPRPVACVADPAPALSSRPVGWIRAEVALNYGEETLRRQQGLRVHFNPKFYRFGLMLRLPCRVSAPTTLVAKLVDVMSRSCEEMRQEMLSICNGEALPA